MAGVTERTFRIRSKVLAIKPGLVKPVFSTTSLTTQIALNPRIGGGGDTNLSNGSSFSFPESYPTNTLCAPFPPCHPLGCGPNKLPIECEFCDSTAVVFTIIGMFLLSMLIVFANTLVIVIILRTTSLRRRQGYIKVSLASADILIGLLVLPSAIYNMVTTLYFPTNNTQVTPRFWKVVNSESMFSQRNSPASVFFGTVLIVSVVSSIYNLLLLTIDRFLAVARPIQTQSEKYFTKNRLIACIAFVWFFGLILSSLPAFLPQHFSYRLDGTTFFFLQTINEDSTQTLGIFSFFVFGIPYILVVIFSFATLFLTISKLKFRRRNSRISRHGKSKQTPEQAERMKIIMNSFPEMRSNNRENHLLKWARNKFTFHNSSHTFEVSEIHRSESVAATLERSKAVKTSIKKVNVRVAKMIVTMVVAFTVCVCPYTIVGVMLANGALDCSNAGVAYNVAIYLVMINSIVNFFIYNFWHKEFREKLTKMTTRSRSSSSTSTFHTSTRTKTLNPKCSRGTIYTKAHHNTNPNRKIGSVKSFSRQNTCNTEL